MIASVDSASGVQNGAPAPSSGGDAPAAADDGAFAEQVTATAAAEDSDFDAAVEQAEDEFEDAVEEGGESGGSDSFFMRGERVDQVTAADGVAQYARNLEILEASEQILGTRFDMVL